MENKKTILFRTYQILERRTDPRHPIKQQEIIDLLAIKHDIHCDRKTVGRNINSLRDMGYEIPNVGKDGVYLSSRRLENSELRLLIDCIMCSKYINEVHSRELIEKLVSFGGEHFRSHVKHITRLNDWKKSENLSFMYNIELVDEAIEGDMQIAFYYDKQLKEGQRPSESIKKQVVNPYQLFLHNQNYYLACNYDKYDNLIFCRMDKITNMSILETPRKPIKEITHCDDGLDIAAVASSLPYLFGGDMETVVFRMHNCIIDDVIDRFGKTIKIEADINDSNHSIATIQTTQNAMLYWCQQYCTFIEVLTPQSLRDTLRENFTTALKRYKK
ncbi:MAG: WYL domain-containing protein [Bacillota bacterium]